MTVDFFKYQALGNDYIVIEPDSKWFSPTEASIKKLCDRHKGIGSDGILYGPFWENAVPVLRIYNPDGSEAEKSGNGLRIFAQHLYNERHTSEMEFKIKTISGIVDVKIENENASEVTINMGQVSFDPKRVPLKSENEWIDKVIKTPKGEFQFTILSIGNPHAVFFPDKWDEKLIFDIGPFIESHHLLPKRTNVQMVRILDKQNIDIRIWERGAGFTQASGSSSCAAAYAAYYLKKASSSVNVRMPGGELSIFIDENKSVYMKGEVKPVFRGVLSKSDKK